MSDLISRKYLYDKMLEKEELARQRVLDTPTHSPAYLRYVAQLNERTALKHEIADAPTVEAVPKSYAEQIRWERDVAVGQLNEIGCQFGQKMDEVKKKLEVLQWIPCSERLPNKDEYLKNDGRFIVTDGNRVYQSIYDIYSAHCFRTLVLFDFGSGSNFEVDNCVIAWMPLPEPYKTDMRTSAE